MTDLAQSVPEFSLQLPSFSKPVHKEDIEKFHLRTRKVSLPQETMLSPSHLGEVVASPYVREISLANVDEVL